MAVAPGSNPGSRVVSTDDPTIIGQVVVNADGSAVGGGGGGSATAANQVLQITQETATAAVAGVTTGAAVITDANGTIQQYLRGLVKLIVAKITVVIDQTTPGTTNAVSATNLPTTVSVNTGATGASSPRVTVAVDSATVAGSATLPAGANIIGKVGIDQTTPGTTNKVNIGTDGTVTVTGVSTAANQVAATKVGSTVVTNITEHRTISTGLTAATTTVASGGLTISMAFSSDFAGSIAMDGGSDQTWVGADGPYNDSPAPSNLLPAYVVKRSAGTYKIVTGTP